jgi:hypothetical protein
VWNDVISAVQWCECNGPLFTFLYNLKSILVTIALDTVTLTPNNDVIIGPTSVWNDAIIGGVVPGVMVAFLLFYIIKKVF